MFSIAAPKPLKARWKNHQVKVRGTFNHNEIFSGHVPRTLLKRQIKHGLSVRFRPDFWHRTPTHIARDLTHLLQAREVFLHIGLARGWKEHPDRCYLQITGIYTFPDYLEGRTWRIPEKKG